VTATRRHRPRDLEPRLLTELLGAVIAVWIVWIALRLCVHSHRSLMDVAETLLGPLAVGAILLPYLWPLVVLGGIWLGALVFGRLCRRLLD
jgi:hypothetical protein